MNSRLLLIALGASAVNWLLPATSTATPPPNDNFANRMVLTGQAVSSDPVTIDDATREGLERSDTGNQTVWYRWTPSQDGTVNITTAGTTAGQVHLSIFNGDSLANHVAIIESEGGQSVSVTFYSKAGIEYECCIGARYNYGHQSGVAVLNINNRPTTITSPSVVGAPAGSNDNFANAKALTGPTVSGLTYPQEATRETQEPTYNGNHTVWWVWTAPFDSDVTMNTAGSDFQNVLTVFTGSALSNLTSVAFNYGSTSPVTFAATSGNVYRVSVATRDNYGTGIDSVLNINASPANPPVITSATSGSVLVGSSYSYQITASNSPINYAASGLPAGLSVNTDTGLISGTPTVAGTFNVMISAANNKGSGSTNLQILVKPRAPVITSATSATGKTGLAFNYQITASNTPTSYSATGLPAGLSVNTASGKISGTPTTVGTFSIALKASNAGGTGSATLKLIVTQGVPVITSSLSPSARQDVAFSYQITATNSPTSYSANGVPAGLAIHASTGKIDGHPTTAGTFHVTIGATNSVGTGTATLTLVVKPAAPVITSSLAPGARQGVAFVYQITATNDPTSYTASGLPTGLTFSTSTGKISGTPTKVGTYNVSISATNAGGTGTATLSLVVKQALPVITSDLNPGARQGVAFSYQIVATNNPTSFATSSIPPGLSFSTATGKFSGTPTKAGTYKPLISATNSGGTASVNLNLVVKPPL